MKFIGIVMSLAAVFSSIAPGSMAETIRVAQDGTGDFSVIQLAVDAAAPGDTISIGPGNYAEFASFSLPGWTSDTYVGVSVDSLTLIGDDRDTVVIGALTPGGISDMSKGIVTQTTLTSIRIQDISVVNVGDGLYLLGSAFVERCYFDESRTGIIAFTLGGLQVSTCEFAYHHNNGIAVVQAAGSTRIVDSDLLEPALGILVLGTQGVVVDNCTFSGGVIGVQFEQGTVGAVRNSRFEPGIANLSLNVLSGSTAEVTNNLVMGGRRLIDVHEASHLSGSGNRILSDLATSTGLGGMLTFTSSSTADLHRNDIILVFAVPFVKMDAYYGEDIYLDMTDNYWGHTDASAIAARIRDGNDSSLVHGFVVFEPFAYSTTPTASKSVGSFKAPFKRE